jgi:hypothetical protein
MFDPDLLMPKYAQVLSGVVQNVIVLDDYNDIFKQGFDELINVDGLFVGPGFSYDGHDFIPPPPDEEQPQ